MEAWSAAFDAVQKLRDRKAPVKVFVAVTGAGTGLQDILWSVPGISSAFAGAVCPYGAEQSDDFLGFRPESYCSADTAVDYAMMAYVRARESVLADGSAKAPVGLGITASVASNAVHRGEHRVFLCTITPFGAMSWYVRLPKGAGSFPRERDGQATDLLGLSAILAAVGEPPLLGSIVSDPRGDVVMLTQSPEIPPAELRKLFFRRPVFSRSGMRHPIERLDVANLALMPASLNPPHEGHRRMADIVERERRKRVVYMVTADSVHKPPLSVPEMLDRVAAVRRQRWSPGGARTVVFTQGDPLFLDKARRWPCTEFVVGADTVLRMLDPRWGVDPEPLLHELQGLGTRFLVFGREVDGRFVPADAVLADVPPFVDPYRTMFAPMPGRWDVSSTRLREVTP